MFVRNLDPSSHYICSSYEGKALIKLGVPLLSRYEDKMVFAKTKRLEEALKKLPLTVKLVEKFKGDKHE